MLLRKRILIKLENMGLTRSTHIVYEDRSAPEDIQKNYLSHRGAIYGTVSNRKKNHGFKHPKHSERYENLYFVGGTVNPGAGMPMVTLSGQQVSEMITKENTDKKDDDCVPAARWYLRRLAGRLADFFPPADDTHPQGDSRIQRLKGEGRIVDHHPRPQ